MIHDFIGGIFWIHPSVHTAFSNPFWSEERKQNMPCINIIHTIITALDGSKDYTVEDSLQYGRQ